ncbi:MAG: DarT ssDNA thymidine ADP-ribosyltransferase family protein [Candidatus Onthomorpha sp.]|nr:DarT ssDNA thymidine ADP-ribosyltransferase family protein [Bacteroidales bacterium]MCI7407635.1 DarT ssDNA thymidine ADP-ribosyltransferase family protein [Bacteroidales bacterium]MDD7485932.1 DarT ssDNA thymidine ADP-ribosyltransferase family protein [Bacteroidales bacterium]MDY5698939.1 DarT ssDNA thymidine ADP-ribosyltransferase family protein [Candidatus Onthomorpha sp.]
MEKKDNWESLAEVAEKHGVEKLYHFTDRDNLESIIKNGGLYSWADCQDKGITICKPGGGELSRSLDKRDNLHHYVRVSFAAHHPMMYVAMNEERISNPVVLEIDPEVIYWKDTKYSDRNATKNGAKVGSSLKELEAVHFDSVLHHNYFDLTEEEQPFYQAEVLVKNFIPLKYIRNISNFGIALPHQPQLLQSRSAYTAQITRNTPTAFIFLVDNSVSMHKRTVLLGEEITMSEAAARIVNRQINDLVLRCIKLEEVRHYYDIAVIGYGESAYSGWSGKLADRDFVSPKELMDNPYKTITTREEKRTRKGMVIKEVEKVQWVEARHDGSWTHVHKAFDKAKALLDEWMKTHHDKDCYPPTIINITDGEFNGATKDMVLQRANELKSMFTNDGNVILFNIHFTANKSEQEVVCPIEKRELNGNSYAETLFEMSSLLPLRYNEDIGKHLNDERSGRHVAMGVNADATTLIKLMDIGTPTNIIQNK